jgi:hypothetical protein
MNTKTERILAMVAALLILLSALLGNTRIAIFVSIATLAVYGIYWLFQKNR